MNKSVIDHLLLQPLTNCKDYRAIYIYIYIDICGVWRRNNRLMHQTMYCTVWNPSIKTHIPTVERFDLYICRIVCY